MSSELVCNSSHVGYKKCRDGRIVKLLILGINNENRQGIANALSAKNRCSRAKVIDIYDMNDRSKKLEWASGILDEDFIYEINKVVEPDDFNSNLDEVCSDGIHYFLTEEPAYFWDTWRKIRDGTYKEWHNNGQISKIYNYKCGILDGLSEEWYPNGQYHVRCSYENGKKNGVFEEWYTTGQIYDQSIYKDGKLDGKIEKFHANGVMMKRSTYKNGISDGLCEKWHENGQLAIRFTHKNGKRDGLFESWHDNGQMKERYMYKKGKRNGLMESWLENGNVSKLVNYKDGKIIKNN